jgi:hypothetical protein
MGIPLGKLPTTSRRQALFYGWISSSSGTSSVAETSCYTSGAQEAKEGETAAVMEEMEMEM